METPLISTLYLNLIFAACERAGIDYESIVNSEYTNDVLLASPKNCISLEELLTILQRISDHTNDPVIAIKLGNLVHISDFGLIGQIAMNHYRIGDAIAFTSKLSKFLNCSQLSHAFWNNNEFIYRFDSTHFNPEFARAYFEMNTAMLKNITKSITKIKHRHQVVFSEIRFCHKPAASKQNYESLLKTPVLFNQIYNEVVMKKSLFDIPTHEPQFKLLEAGLNLLYHNKKYSFSEKPFAHKVELYIYNNYQHKYPTATDTAKALGVSLSTLKQKLFAEDTSFKLVNEVIQIELATTFLSESTMTISEIAFLLGYSSSATFHRAFKRRMGYSPNVYREIHLYKENS